MKILILGDCHGRLDLVAGACQAAELAYGIDAAIQVGDFGLFPKVMHRFLTDDASAFPVPVHVIDGNHEDHEWIHRARGQGQESAWAARNLFYHERGSIAALDGASIGFLGGALHADRRQEWDGQWRPGADGTPAKRTPPEAPAWANWVTRADTTRALAAFVAQPPDLIVSHSCPASIGIGISGALALVELVDRFVTRAGFHAGPFHDCGEGGLTRLWRELPRKPAHWVFGHFHQFSDTTVDHTQFVCVGSSDDSDGVVGVRPVIYDTCTKELLLEPGKRL